MMRTTPETVTLPRAFRLAGGDIGVIEAAGFTARSVTVARGRSLVVRWWPGGTHISRWRAEVIAGKLAAGSIEPLEA